MPDFSKLPPPMPVDSSYVPPPPPANGMAGGPRVHADIYPIQGQVKMGEVTGFTIRCDEAIRPGSAGTGTAPSPLGYFTLGLGFCLMTHLTNVQEAMGMQVENLKVHVEGQYATEGSTLKGDRKAIAKGYSMEVSMDTKEPSDRVAEFIRRAEAECYASAALKNPLPLGVTAQVNGDALKLD